MKTNAQLTRINSSNLETLIKYCDSTYADEILIVHKNKIVKHWKNEGCDSVLFNTASMVKSWTGIVIGILIDKGMIKSVNDYVCQYIPEWEDGCDHKVTIKNLLTMSAGLNRRRNLGIISKDDMNQYAMSVKLDTLPNIRFGYSNESVQLLGIIIERVTGKKAQDYFNEVLFGPLEMSSTTLFTDKKGNDMVFGGAKTTILDAMKIALLYTNNGLYKGKSIVSKKWINESLEPSEFAPYYGYLWWLDNQSEDKNYAAQGDFGQLTIIFPNLDLIFLRQQSCNKTISGNMTFMGPAFLKLITGIVIK